MQQISLRRSRFVPLTRDKKIYLVERDYAVFRLLDRYHFLTRDDLCAFLKPRSTKRFVERLGHLFHDARYVERPPQQWQTRDRFRSAIVHSLSDTARDLLLDLGLENHRAVIRNNQQPGYRIPQFDHALAVSQSLAAIELQTLNMSNERFVPLEEILSRKANPLPLTAAPLSLPVNIPGATIGLQSDLRTQIIPDGLYGIEYSNSGSSKFRFFPIELERTTPLRRRSLTKSSTVKKILAYRALLYSGEYKSSLGIPNLFPHFIGRDADHQAQIENLAKSLLTEKEFSLFRFSAHVPPT